MWGPNWPPLVQINARLQSRGSNWPPLMQKTLPLPTGGSNWPFRCLDLCRFVAKSVTHAVLSRNCFATIYALSCGEKLSPEVHLWRKNDFWDVYLFASKSFNCHHRSQKLSHGMTSHMMGRLLAKAELPEEVRFAFYGCIYQCFLFVAYIWWLCQYLFVLYLQMQQASALPCELVLYSYMRKS